VTFNPLPPESATHAGILVWRPPGPHVGCGLCRVVSRPTGGLWVMPRASTKPCQIIKKLHDMACRFRPTGAPCEPTRMIAPPGSRPRATARASVNTSQRIFSPRLLVWLAHIIAVRSQPWQPLDKVLEQWAPLAGVPGKANTHERAYEHMLHLRKLQKPGSRFGHIWWHPSITGRSSSARSDTANDLRNRVRRRRYECCHIPDNNVEPSTR